MFDEIFDMSQFNVIEDDDNYYFFRALNNGDYSDIINGITTEDGKLSKIRTDRERYTDTPIYNEDDEISLEEVHDHIKWGHRKDTNCISLSTDANVVATYGRDNYHDQYAFIKIPKDQINSGKVYIGGRLIIEEINKRIQELIDNKFLNPERINYLEKIDKVESNEELFDLLNEYSKDFNKKIYKDKYYEYYALNDEQNFEKNKLIAKLDVLNRRLLSRCSNRLLVESIKFAFSSEEIIHYKAITDNFKVLSSKSIDLFSLLQQAKSIGMDSIKIKELEEKVLQYIKDGKDEENIEVPNYSKLDSDIKISDIYNLTYGEVSFAKAKRALEFSQSVANSKVKTKDTCGLLKEIVNDSNYDSFIDEIESKCYVIDPTFVSRNLQEGLPLSGSICLSANRDSSVGFLPQEEKALLHYINSLSNEEKKEFIEYNVLKKEKVLCDLLLSEREESIDLNRYYAETILDYLDLDEIYKASYIDKVLTKEEKERIVSYLQNANCIKMFDSLKELNIDDVEISRIIFNLLLNDGYQGMNFVDLSNSGDFKQIISSNLENINTKVSALRMDYLLGIKDNDNHILTTDINLRDYQQLAVNRVDEIFENKNFAGVVLPTGAGKSFVAITEMLKYKDKNILYYAPNREILRQLQKNIVKYVLRLNIIPEAQESYYREHSNMIPDGFIFQDDIEDMIGAALPQLKMYCYQGLIPKDDEFFQSRNAGLIVLDEVHRTGANEWNDRISSLIKNNPDAKILGITATPVRDVDNQDMVESLARFSGSYTEEEIKKKRYMAAEMYLVDAMQEGIVVTPNIVTFDYTFENNEKFIAVKEKYENEKNPYKKERLKKIYDEMREIVEKSQKRGMSNIIKEGFEKNHKPFNGRYIVFLPTNSTGVPTEEYMLKEIEKVKEYFKDIDPNPEVEYLLSNRKFKSENNAAISRFENDSNHLKLIFAINMLNEGVHVDGIDGVVMLRPLSAGTKILYYQQIGRCIYSLDPNHELEPSEFPVIFDVYNNYIEQNLDRQVNRHTVTSDLQKLRLIIEWINKHYRYPDINSESITEARKAITLKRIQKKYSKYIDNPTYSKNLSDTEIYEIEEIIRLGSIIDLWDIVIPERTIEPNEQEIEKVSAFEIKGDQKRLVDLFEEAEEITKDKNSKSRKLQLIEILNILDVLAENGVDINNNTISYYSILNDVYKKLPEDVLSLINQDIKVTPDWEIGKAYNDAKKQFYRKNPIFLDYDINTLRKMGIFETFNPYKYGQYDMYKDMSSVNENGFIVHGPTKFLNLNIYTGTYRDESGLDINGLDKQNFSGNDGFYNKYGFGRDGYYYELSEDGSYIPTGSLYNPYGFDVNGNYCEPSENGEYKVIGRVNPFGFDIDGIYNKYNRITKEYTKTKNYFNDRGFTIDGIYSAKGESIGLRKKSLEYVDGVTRYFDNISYVTSPMANQYARFSTELPYDLNYFDMEGYYYKLDKNGNRVKTYNKYNERYLDAEGYYYEEQPDGTRVKTDRLYDDNYYDLEGYYYEEDENGNRVKTKYKKNKVGENYLGLIVKYTYNERMEQKQNYVAFDREGFCYYYNGYMFVKMEPASKISKYGFDVDGYYHELLEDGTRDENPTDKRVDPHDFDECGIYKGKESHLSPTINEFGFDQAGYYWDYGSYNRLRRTDSKVDKYGFDIDQMYDFKRKDGTTVKRPYNNRFLSRDGYYYKRVQLEDGSFKRVKTRRKIDSRGFDLDGNHYDIFVNRRLNKVEYLNRRLYDKYGFDVDGIFYEIPHIKYLTGNTRELKLERKKTNPPRIYNEKFFNYLGYYCEVDGENVKVTSSKYNQYGFDIDGYYKELDENGNKTLFDSHGFNSEGYYSYIDSDGNRTATDQKYDSYHFYRDDYYNYSKGIIKLNEYGFDVEGNYRDKFNINVVLGKCDNHGFDIDGYYHELLEDGTRSEIGTEAKYNERGFDRDGYYYDLLEDGTRTLYRTSSRIDENGFDVDGFYHDGGVVRAYNNRRFDVNGYYYDEKGKTDRMYDDNGFGFDEYYYKLLEDGTRVKTDSKFNPDGVDYRGFKKDGTNIRTNLKYDENYFNIDGINIVTNKKYSLTGYDKDGNYNPVKVSSYAKKELYGELEAVYIAKRFLNLPLEKKDIIYDDIPGNVRNKKALNESLYAYIIAAAVLDPNVKEMLVEYTSDLIKEIDRLKDELQEEKSKKNKNNQKIKNYEKLISNYNEIKRKTVIGDISGRGI